MCLHSAFKKSRTIIKKPIKKLIIRWWKKIYKIYINDKTKNHSKNTMLNNINIFLLKNKMKLVLQRMLTTQRITLIFAGLENKFTETIMLDNNE